MTTPRTKAGRALVARYLYDKSEPDYISILAIEAEAAAEAAPPSGLDVERLRQAMARILDRTTFRRLEPYLPMLAAEYAESDTETVSPTPDE